MDTTQLYAKQTGCLADYLTQGDNPFQRYAVHLIRTREEILHRYEEQQREKIINETAEDIVKAVLESLDLEI